MGIFGEGLTSRQVMGPLKTEKRSTTINDTIKFLRDTSREIAEALSEALRDNMAMSYIEKTVLQQCFYEYAQDLYEGVDNGREYKMAGILDWLRQCGKIDEEADEMLWSLMNSIQMKAEGA